MTLDESVTWLWEQGGEIHMTSVSSGIVWKISIGEQTAGPLDLDSVYASTEELLIGSIAALRRWVEDGRPQ